jgi:hypothetical protein
MKRADKVIITCAITGGIHTPSMSPYLPITPAQIAAHSLAAAEAGAAVIHLHARDPETGKPDQTPERFLEFLPAKYKLVCKLDFGDVMMQTLIWIVLVMVTLGIALPFFIYFFLRLIIHKTEIHQIA